MTRDKHSFSAVILQFRPYKKKKRKKVDLFIFVEFEWYFQKFGAQDKLLVFSLVYIVPWELFFDLIYAVLFQILSVITMLFLHHLFLEQRSNGMKVVFQGMSKKRRSRSVSVGMQQSSWGMVNIHDDYYNFSPCDIIKLWTVNLPINKIQGFKWFWAWSS